MDVLKAIFFLSMFSTSLYVIYVNHFTLATSTLALDGLVLFIWITLFILWFFPPQGNGGTRGGYV